MINLNYLKQVYKEPIVTRAEKSILKIYELTKDINYAITTSIDALYEVFKNSKIVIADNTKALIQIVELEDEILEALGRRIILICNRLDIDLNIITLNIKKLTKNN